MDRILNKVTCIACAVLLLRSTVLSCIFPEQLQGQTWYTNVRPSTGRRTAVYFRGGIMERQEQFIKTKYVVKVTEQTCIDMIDMGIYIVKTSDELGDAFRCVEFVNRSKSVWQLKLSHLTAEPNRNSCARNLLLDPMLYVSYPLMEQEFTTCPFSGGYNMKIIDANGIDHGCNFMDLPMRFESECLGGDGIYFDFRSPNCIGQMPMKQLQKAICVTHWRNDGDVFSVLSKYDDDTLWCLRIPARSSYSGTVLMYLYTDLICPTVDNELVDANYVTLELELVPQTSLCVDEHKNCHRLPCNGFFDTQCLKSCGKCDPNIYPTACDFPRRHRGDWFLNDQFGITSINISETRFHIENIGSFDCVTFQGSPLRKTKLFTTMSFFSNGCRPRFTCVGFSKLGPNVLGYKISETLVWPLSNMDGNVGASICDENLFRADSPPIRDAYRPYTDVYKPIISISKAARPQSCTFISSYLFNATLNFADGKMCQGILYQDCKDSTRMRVEYIGCWYEPEVLDFQCIGNLEGRYWERTVVIQNMRDVYDTRCIIFSDLKLHKVLMVRSGECDKYSWMYVDAGIRKPIIDFTVAAEEPHCRDIIETTTTHAPPEPINDAWHSGLYSGNERDGLIAKQISSAHVPQTTIPFNKYIDSQKDKTDTHDTNSEVLSDKNSFSSFSSVSNVCAVLFCLVAFMVSSAWIWFQ